MTGVSAVVFVLACLLAMLGFGLALVELVAGRAMTPWVFRCGPRLSTRGLPELASLDVRRLVGLRGQLGRLRYRNLRADAWLLLDTAWIGSGTTPVKATLRMAPDRRSLDARASLGLTLFVVGWSVGWVTAAISQAHKAGKSERVIMALTGHRSAAMVRRYIRDADLFSDNAASGIGL